MAENDKFMQGAGSFGTPEPSSPPTAFEPPPGLGSWKGRHDSDAAETAFEPVVEQLPSQQVAKWLASDASPVVKPLVFSAEDIHEFRPALRPPVPVLTVLDDGSQDEGEQYRLRGEVFTIGRTSGDVRLPNDVSMSGQHAEIRRTVWKGGFQWQLMDVGSVNGTLVRCARAILHENAILLLGSRRFRLRNPLRPSEVPAVGPVTRLMDGAHIPETVWPVLSEASSKTGALQFPVRQESMTIGRAGSGADIELDDPLLANRHARLDRRHDGTWVISAENTRNGIWVSTARVQLNAHCYFRCGEQRFRFALP